MMCQPMICQHCNAEIRNDSNFCTYCGGAVAPQCNVPQDAAPQYATPQYAGHLGTGHLNTGQHRLDLPKVLGDTLKFYTRHFVILCFVGLIVLGIPAIITVCQLSVQQAYEDDFIGAPTMVVLVFGLIFLNLLAQCYMLIVANRQCLHLARGGTGLREGLLFPPVLMLLNMVGLMFIVGIAACILVFPAAFVFIFAIALGAMAGGGPAFIMAGIATLILILLPAIWLGTRIWLADIFLVDQNMNCIDALVQAWRASSGNFWALLGAIILLGLPVFCWMVACHSLVYAEIIPKIETIPGLLLLTAGSVPIALFLYFGSVLAYLQLTGQPYRLEVEKENFEFDWDSEPRP